MRSLLALWAIVSILWAAAEACSYPDQFTCSNGQCVQKSLRCNYNKDCSDGSDEMHCSQMLNDCMPPMWWTCDDGECISSLFRCDDMLHCMDESDEKYCGEHHQKHTKITNCTKEEFKCDNMCIPNDWVCNSEPDCFDMTDELKCSPVKNSTLPYCRGFTCDDGQCIYDHWKCDGKEDCKDNSDEKNCTAKAVDADCDLNDGYFPCKDKKACIPAEYLCDGLFNCDDHSDEGEACTDPKKNCVTSKCTHGCINTPDGAFCVCPSGYGRVSNHSCEDLDECHLLHSHCSQHCHNVPGSFFCTCDEGYMIQNDNRSCKVLGPEPVMIFASADHIMGYNLEKTKYFPIIQTPTRPIGVAYDSNYVYWTTVVRGFESINKAFHNGSGLTELVKNGLAQPEDLTVDWYTGNIYFTEAEIMHIGMCTNDGLHCTVLISKNVHKPRSIVLNPNKGEMFWSDWGDRPEIAKANMDGSDDKALVVDKIHWPNGLTIDYPNERLYWVDGKHQSIESVRLDGSFRKSILQNVKHPYSIAVFGDKIYWTDWGSNSIETCNKFTGKDRKIILKVDKVNGLHIYHPVMAPKKNHSCMNNSCDHICLLKGQNGHSCACTEGYILKDDKKRCMKIVDEKYLLLATSDMIMVLHHKLMGGHGFDFMRFPNLRMDSILYDYFKDQVIIYDDREKMIYGIEAFLTKTPKISALVSSDIGSILGMDLDHVSRNLYWCDTGYGTVEVFSLETRSRATLLYRFMDGLYTDVAVVPSIGMMYLAIMRKGQYFVTKIGMDGKGTHVHVIEHGLIGPIQLHYDSLSKQIFISDEGGQKIESIDIHGGHRQGFYEAKMNISSITSLDKEIFWTTKSSKLLHWKLNSPDQTYAKHYKLDIPFNVYRIYATGVQIGPKMKHVCASPSSVCSHICVLSNSDGQSSDKEDSHMEFLHSCLCPKDMVLGSDKKTCEKSIVCDSDYFKCEKSNVCIKRTRLCNHVSDCAFGEDEVGCSEFKSDCEENQFQCRNGRCIEYSERCNKRNDCSDNSDEENCEHYDHHLRCTKTEFICKSGMCLEQILRCDNHTDCPDGDDEENCSKHICPKNFFHCLTGNCIPATWECDKHVDCKDGSDEHNKCLYNKPCETGMFKCRSGSCIDAKLYCDKVGDCDDGSDEFNCPTLEQEIIQIFQDKECLDTEYACETNSTICLPYSARCNGSFECPNGEDEFSCNSEKCLPSEWKCTDSDICIEKQWKCDHSKDCPNGADEDPEMCNLKHNDTEIVKHLIVTPLCINGYLCNSGQCIDYGSLCDGFANCYDGTDENALCNTACSKKLCSDICIPSPRGAICTCNGSRVLGPDGFKCLPPPPACLQNPCQHRCKDNNDSYICSCFEGYGLTSDRSTCKALGEPKSIVFMSSAQLRKLNTRDNSIKVIHKDDTLPLTGMDVFTAKNSIFFAIEKRGEIRHLNFETKKETIVSGLGKPGLIAVDWVSENVYYVNNEAEKSIMVCHMDKQKCAKIRDLETKSLVTALIVDPINKLMFYSLTSWVLDGHPKSTIYVSRLDGTHVIEMVNKDLGQCSGLAVDYERKLLYFSDQQLNKIESINYEMSHRSVILQNSSYAIKPRGLDVFEDELYFLSLGTPKIIICRLQGDKKCSPRNLRMYGVEAFKIDQQSKQKKVVDQCATKNCTHICVQGEFTGHCLCSDGKSADDEEICINTHKHLKFEDGRLLSTHVETPTVNNASGKAISAIIIIIAIVVLVLGALLLYRHQKKKLGNASKLDYSVHFQNPGFGGAFSNFSIGLGNLTSRFPVLSRPTQNEFSNPIETKVVPNDWPPSALDPKLLQLKQKIQGSQLEVPNLLGDSDSDVESDRDFHDGEHKDRARLIT